MSGFYHLLTGLQEIFCTDTDINLADCCHSVTVQVSSFPLIFPFHPRSFYCRSLLFPYLLIYHQILHTHISQLLTLWNKTRSYLKEVPATETCSKFQTWKDAITFLLLKETCHKWNTRACLLLTWKNSTASAGKVSLLCIIVRGQWLKFWSQWISSAVSQLELTRWVTQEQPNNFTPDSFPLSFIIRLAGYTHCNILFVLDLLPPRIWPFAIKEAFWKNVIQTAIASNQIQQLFRYCDK